MGACKDQAKALVECMMQQPCMRDEGKGFQECIKSVDAEGCPLERKAYFECKRAQVDMRTRIRGPRA